jgi:hypothetical protein
MYTIKHLRQFAAATILESEMDSKSKLDLIKFIKTEANETQLKGLVLSGLPLVITEGLEKDINERFDELLEKEQAYGQGRSIRKAGMSIYGSGALGVGTTALAAATKAGRATMRPRVAGAALGVASWGAYRAVRAALDHCTRLCGTFKLNTPKRQACMAKCKLEAAKHAKDKAAIDKWQGRVNAYQSQGLYSKK